jgi:DNA-binding CsgD family transcriptional regulator
MLEAVSEALDERFEAALASIEAASDDAGLQRAILALLQPYGLRHAVYHALRIPQADVSQKVIAFTYPTDWVSYYVSRRLFTIDPVVRAGERSILPVDWCTLDRSPPAVRRLFNEAAEAGLGKQGLTIPIRGPHGDHAIFTVTSDVPDCDWQATKSAYVRDMQLIGNYIHARVIDLYLTESPAKTPSLSGRETEVLRWAAAGKTIDETATILTLSSSAVRTYLDSARHKLDCLTKPQAVARATQLGLI